MPYPFDVEKSTLPHGCLRYDFGRLNESQRAYAFVLPKSVQAKRIFFGTETELDFSKAGTLYLKDEAILLRLDLYKQEVMSIDLEPYYAWKILSYQDLGKSCKLSFQTFPQDEIKEERCYFKPGYKRVRGNVLPSGGAIGLKRRKHYLTFIENDLSSQYLRSA